MKNRKLLRLLLAVACFLYAGVKLSELLRGPGNYYWYDLYLIGGFVMLGLLYTFMFFKHRNQQP